jgi:hypothetical protein
MSTWYQVQKAGESYFLVLRIASYSDFHLLDRMIPNETAERRHIPGHLHLK